MQPRRLRIQDLLNSWNGFLAALLLSACVVLGETAGACEIYGVELRAVFPEQIVMPCTDEEQNIISALLHSLVQTDVILGMNILQPILYGRRFLDTLTRRLRYRQSVGMLVGKGLHLQYRPFLRMRVFKVQPSSFK